MLTPFGDALIIPRRTVGRRDDCSWERYETSYTDRRCPGSRYARQSVALRHRTFVRQSVVASISSCRFVATCTFCRTYLPAYSSVAGRSVVDLHVVYWPVGRFLDLQRTVAAGNFSSTAGSDFGSTVELSASNL